MTFQAGDRVIWQTTAQMIDRDIPVALAGVVARVLSDDYCEVELDLRERAGVVHPHTSHLIRQAELKISSTPVTSVAIGDWRALAEQRKTTVSHLLRDPVDFQKGYRAKLRLDCVGGCDIEIPDSVGDRQLDSANYAPVLEYLRDTAYAGWAVEAIYIEEVEEVTRINQWGTGHVDFSR